MSLLTVNIVFPDIIVWYIVTSPVCIFETCAVRVPLWPALTASAKLWARDPLSVVLYTKTWGWGPPITPGTIEPLSDCENVEKNLNIEYGHKGFELLTVIDMGENNSNKYGKSSRYRYIFKKNEN